MQSLVIYDSTGAVQAIVHFDTNETPNMSDPAWNIPGGVTVAVSRAEFDALPPPENIGGRADFSALSTALLPKIAALNAAMHAKINAHIDGIISRRAAVLADAYTKAQALMAAGKA